MSRGRIRDIVAVVLLSALAIWLIQLFTPARPVPFNVVVASFVMGPALAAFAYGCLRLALADGKRPHSDH